MAKVDVECRACGNEQALTLQLDEHYTDAQLRAQLAEAAECDSCYAIDWSVVEVRA